eukprot:jgi/Botrbrau1/17322/Bobra.0015s0070.1
MDALLQYGSDSSSSEASSLMDAFQDLGGQDSAEQRGGGGTHTRRETLPAPAFGGLGVAAQDRIGVTRGANSFRLPSALDLLDSRAPGHASGLPSALDLLGGRGARPGGGLPYPGGLGSDIGISTASSRREIGVSGGLLAESRGKRPLPSSATFVPQLYQGTSKVARSGTVVQSANAASSARKTSNSINNTGFLPPQLLGRSNVVTEDLDKMGLKKQRKQ